MSANDGDVAFAGRAAVLGRVLLDVKEERFVLGDGCCARIFAYVRGLVGVFADVEHGG